MNLIAAIEWAEGYHRRGLYSPIGVAFHWVMAALMIFQLAYGWYLGWQPRGKRSMTRPGKCICARA